MATTKTFESMFPSRGPSLSSGPTRAFDLHLRGAAIAVATGKPPQKESEAQLQAEWRALSAADRARVLSAFPMTASGLRALKQTPEAKAQRLAEQFPSLKEELLKSLKGG